MDCALERWICLLPILRTLTLLQAHSTLAYLFLTVGHVPNAAPFKGLVWRETVVDAVDVNPFSIHAKQEVCMVLLLLQGGVGRPR